MSNSENEITVRELKQRLDNGEMIILIDVREMHEFQVCRIEGCRLIPMGEIPNRVHELDPMRECVIYCHTGVRSAWAAAYLRRMGFRAKNLKGGIDEWAAEVDPAMPRY